MTRQEQLETAYRSATIPIDVRLAITLRVLAGAEVLDVAPAYCIVCGTVYNILHGTVRVFDTVLQFPRLPRPREELEKVARGFKPSRSQLNPLDGCVGALDGICIKMRQPPRDCNPASFFCRKGYYAIPVQALCDSNYVFLYASGRCGGAIHDALANAVSGFMKEVEDGLLGEYFWVVGDEAYPVSESIIVPYPSSTLTEDQDNFNFYLSSLRIHIEQAFGILVARWRILRDRLDFGLEHCTAIMPVAMKLHNYCIAEDSARGRRGWDILNDALSPQERTEMEIDQGRYIEEMRAVNRAALERMSDTNYPVARNTRSSVRSRRREVLKAIVTDKGLVRPAYSVA